CPDRPAKTSDSRVWSSRSTFTQNTPLARIAGATELSRWTQIRSVGFSVSALTEVMAETVIPARPAFPSVVTMLTVWAARLIPARKPARRSLSVLTLASAARASRCGSAARLHAVLTAGSACNRQSFGRSAMSPARRWRRGCFWVKRVAAFRRANRVKVALPQDNPCAWSGNRGFTEPTMMRRLPEMPPQQRHIAPIGLEADVEDIPQHRDRADEEVDRDVPAHARQRAPWHAEPVRPVDDVGRRQRGCRVADARHQPQQRIEPEPDPRARDAK